MSTEQGQSSDLHKVIPPTSESGIWEAEFKAKIIMPEHTNLSKSGHLSKSQFPYSVMGTITGPSSEDLSKGSKDTLMLVVINL